jgi:caffeoyl-CoA O-methyltransferase
VSENPTIVSQDHFRYVAARTLPEDAFLRDLKRAAQEAGIPPIWIAPEQASLMQILLRLTAAREVVEVGTLAGYSAIAMARALPADGRVRSIEIDPERAAFAESWVARSDVAGRVQVLRGSASELLPTLADACADAAFLDADKESYVAYLEQCRRIVRPGGLIMADNAFAFGQLFAPEPTDPGVAALREFNDHVARQTWLQGIIVAVGDGLWVCVKS